MVRIVVFKGIIGPKERIKGYSGNCRWSVCRFRIITQVTSQSDMGMEQVLGCTQVQLDRASVHTDKLLFTGVLSS
jgi:hypothetical protein